MIELLDDTPESHLIYADWLDDGGHDSVSWRLGPAMYAGYYIIGIGSGSGSGSGRGIGSGIGIGIGRGIGIGIGSGSGSGSGRGIGRGIGGGIGRGIGRGIGSILTGGDMKPGKAYIIHCGDWHTFVGRLVSPSTPLLYEFESVSKIDDTNNGDCWHDLAVGKGDLRAAASYIHHQTNVTLPVSIAAIEWVGKTPQEEGL